jgi:Zn-dependent metalloprotease
VAVDEAYGGFGATFDLYWDVYRRNSIDNNGMDLVGTVHYGDQSDNATRAPSSVACNRGGARGSEW